MYVYMYVMYIFYVITLCCNLEGGLSKREPPPRQVNYMAQQNWTWKDAIQLNCVDFH